MARIALTRLVDADLSYTPEPPVFTPLTAAILPDADNVLTSIDQDILAVGSSILSEPDEASAMDQHLTLAEFQPGAFESANYAPVILDYQSSVPGVEGQIGNLEGGVGAGGGPGGPGPGPPGPPTSGGGGSAGPGPCANDVTRRGTCSLAPASAHGLVNLLFYAFKQNCGGGQNVERWDSSQLFEFHQQSPPYAIVILTFSTAQVGHWEFEVEGTLYRNPAKPRFGVCYDVFA
jgi:hypothetical protein